LSIKRELSSRLSVRAAMGMFGGDNELGNILQEAVKLKSAQMGQKKKTYETWPFFVQHTLFHGEKEDYKAWRQLPFDEKIVKSEQIKEEGNQIYAKGTWSDAVDKYEEAATLVYYCYSTDPGWRKNNRGIDDDVLVLVDDPGSTEEDAKRQKKLRLTCALNIAACKLQLQKYEEAIAACDYTLELDPKNVKALYRRAEARVRPSKATAYDHDQGIKDLAKAQALDSKNTTVSKLLNDLRADRKVQRTKDKGTFEGMFGRGEIYDQAEIELAQALEREKAQKASCSTDNTDLTGIQSRIDNISEDDTVEKRLADAELLRDLYMRNGKEEEAQALNVKISEAKKAIKARDAPPSYDWENPTPDMIEDAKKWDLDLTDPMVIEELKRLEREGKLGPRPDGEDDLPPDGSTSCAPPDGGSDLPLPTAEPTCVVYWHRYFILFGLMFSFFKLLESGVLWQGVKRLPLTSDSDTDEDRTGLFTAVFRTIKSLFVGRSEREDDDL